MSLLPEKHITLFKICLNGFTLKNQRILKAELSYPINVPRVRLYSFFSSLNVRAKTLLLKKEYR